MAFGWAGACKLPVPNLESNAGEIKRLYVHPDHQGKKLGSRILERMLTWLGDEGFEPLYIGVWSENYGGQRLYARYGFDKVSEYEFAVGNHRDREFILKLYLHKKSGRYVVYEKDITGAFPRLRNIVIKQGSDIVSLARDLESGEELRDHCIEYHQDEALEVKGDETPIGVESTLSPSTIGSMTFPDAHLYRYSSSSRSRTESTASSLSTVDSVMSNQYTNARAVRDLGYFVSPPDTPIDTENHTVTLGVNLEHQSRGNQKSIQGRHMRSSSHSGQHSHQQEVQYGSMTAAVGRLRRSASTTGPRNAAGPESTSYPTNSANDIGDSMESLNLTKAFTADVNSESLYPVLDPSTHSNGFRIPVARSERPDSIMQTRDYLQLIESRFQSFEQLMAQGLYDQAQIVGEQAESIKQEMALYHESSLSEVAKSLELQTQILKMTGEADRMVRQILELQKEQAANSQRMMRKLTKIMNKASAILIQTYELHEFPIPRLFIVLPKGDITTTREKVSTVFVDRFRLYFLCECGEHTRRDDGIPSTQSHHIHLARHGGYDLDRPNEFFRKYGFYVLALLQMLKYGVVITGMVVQGLDSLKIVEGLDYVVDGLKMTKKDLIPKVDSAIEYLKDLTKAQKQLSHDVGNVDSTTTQVNSTSIGKLEGLEGADLRNLASFLRGSDDGMVLGNLYRTVTRKGHVKWVCLDHYRESYGSAADEAFKKTVEENGGTYGQHTGRVTMHLASPTLARQFYNMMLSTRLVHELELTLDWNTGFEDLRDVKQAVMHSNISRLVLDFCNNTSPRLDAITRNHRSEPIINIMAHPKIHTLALKNITSFLSPTKDTFKTTTFHLREFDLDELVHFGDNFGRLENLVRGSPVLERLAIVVSDIVAAFDQLRPLAVEHKTLSTIDLRLKDGTAALVQFEKGTDNISGVGLKIVENWPLRLKELPVVTSVELLAKNPPLHSSQRILEFIKLWNDLKTVTVAQLPDGGADVLLALQRAVDIYSRSMEDTEAVSGKETVQTGADAAQADPDKSKIGFLELEMAHRRSIFRKMVLLVASVDGAGTTTETSTEIQGTTAAPSNVTHSSISTFTLSRADGSLATVRFELGQDGSNSVVLHVGDFDALGSFGYVQASKLTLVGGRSLGRLKDLSKDAVREFSHLKVLVFEYKLEHILDVLHYVHESTTRFPKLKQLFFWNASDKTEMEFSLPLQEFRLLGHTLSKEYLSSLENLLRTAPALSQVALSVPSLLEAFKMVSSAAKEHKRLSHVDLATVASQMSIQFIVGTGDVQSIALHTSESDLDLFLSFPMVTELSVWSRLKESHIKKLATSVFTHFQHLSMLNIIFSNVHVLEVIDDLSQGFRKESFPCQVVLTKFGADSSHVEKDVLKLPLTTLDITSRELGDEDHEIMERVYRTNQELQQLYVSVKSAEAAFRIYNFILQERRPLTTLSINLSGGPTAVFSLESGSSKDALTVIQKVSQAKIDSLFFLPAVDVNRVDIVGVDISTSQAAEIAIYVLRHCCEVDLIRFPNLPSQVKSIARLIEDSVRRGAVSPDRDETVEGMASGATQSRYGGGSTSNVEGAALALYEALRLGLSRTSESVPVLKGEEYIYWIMRIRPNGLLEEVRLDWSGIDEVTLSLTATPFEESDVARLSSVTELQIPVCYSATLLEIQINKPVETFAALERLELSCSFSQHLAVLTVALTAASNHKVLKKVKIWHPDRGSVGTAYSLPITTLDLTKHSVPTVKDPLVKNILLASPSLLELSLTVSDPISAFKVACSKVWSHGSLTKLYLHDKDENTIYIRFKSGTGSAISVGVACAKSSSSKLQWDLPALKMMFSSDFLLEIVGAAQEATLDNPGLQCLTLRNMDRDAPVSVGMPLRTIDLKGQVLSDEHLVTLQQFLLTCPLLATLYLTVASVSNLLRVTRLLQPVFQKFKALTNVRLMLDNGTTAYIRFKDEDGTVASVALQVTAKISGQLSAIPNVKKIRICPDNPSRLNNIDNWSAIDRILQIFPKLETLELDVALASPLSGLLYFQHQVQTYPTKPFRRLRQRMLSTSKELSTIDLPLRVLHLEVERAGMLTSTDLMKLFLASPLLSELKITLPTRTEIDAVYEILIRTAASSDRLETWMIKSNDGYAISGRLEGSSQIDEQDNQASREVETVEFQVSGSQWPLCFRSSHISRLVVSFVPKSVDNSVSGMLSILSLADRQFSCLRYLTLTCPINNFFDYLRSVAAIRTVTQFDLQDPTSNRTILSSTFGAAPVAIVFLSEISTGDFLSTFSSIFSAYHLRAEIGQHEGEQPEFNVSLRRRAEDEDNIFGRVVLGARGVSCKEVLELLDVIGSMRGVDSGLVFLFKWWTERTSGTGPADEKGKEQQAITNGVLGSETMVALVKLLAWRVTEFDTDYETMMALVPLVKAEVERDYFGWLKPFSLLRHYHVDCADESLRSDFLKFQSLIPEHAKGSFCDPESLLHRHNLSSFEV
ncbi:hypothetical protein EC957_009420 [Mortierella hygrophila]|uniref:N-acetyltransferase domain-containing protein n=1 Tax=Mortierella hygrophila TaxID=979708 RepID=A0A9P6JXB3_9FUNG|nr:hypothetical protein EC957_009420 [Mortierella hygrophila]